LPNSICGTVGKTPYLRIPDQTAQRDSHNHGIHDAMVDMTSLVSAQNLAGIGQEYLQTMDEGHGMALHGHTTGSILWSASSTMIESKGCLFSCRRRHAGRQLNHAGSRYCVTSKSVA